MSYLQMSVGVGRRFGSRQGRLEDGWRLQYRRTSDIIVLGVLDDEISNEHT
jgi:hypothetical protein